MLPGAGAVASSLRRAKRVRSTTGQGWARVRTARTAARRGPLGQADRSPELPCGSRPGPARRPPAARARRGGDGRCSNLEW
eukprot:scaffold81662_cov63-Phaeocystis_antarctica.AAC.3